MNNVLITGSTGFVGRALSARLMEGSVRVRGAVRNSVQAAELQVGIDAVPIGSIGPDTDWRPALEGVDTVIHLAAAVAKPGAGSDQGDVFHQVNVLGSKNLAEAAAASGARRLVYMSSIEVNGTANSGKPFSEDDEPDPRTDYGYSKLRAEQELLRVGDSSDLEIVIIRPPFIYGPGNLGNQMSLIMSLINRGVPLPLASVANHRSIIYIENLIAAVICCCTSTSAAGKIFLVSDGPTISTPELVRVIAAGMKKKPRLFSFPVSWLRLGGRIIGKGAALRLLTDSYYVDSSKIMKEVGWKPPFSTEEGISAALRARMRD